jgi:hypothetical protein
MKRMIVAWQEWQSSAGSALTGWLLGLGVIVTLAENVAHGLGHGLQGVAVARDRTRRLL